jgi:hypothetical protein
MPHADHSCPCTPKGSELHCFKSNCRALGGLRDGRVATRRSACVRACAAMKSATLLSFFAPKAGEEAPNEADGKRPADGKEPPFKAALPALSAVTAPVDTSTTPEATAMEVRTKSVSLSRSSTAPTDRPTRCSREPGRPLVASRHLSNPRTPAPCCASLGGAST